MDFLFRFDTPRAFQGRMMQDIHEALSCKRDILINAPTGVGKTDASISAALTYAMENQLKVFFLTPKISQHRIALEVLAGIRRRFSPDLQFTDMVGKPNLCTNPEVNMLENEVFYRACDERAKKGRCRYFTAAKDRYSGAVPADLVAAGGEGHNALMRASFDHGACAYEVSAYLARNSRVIIADYAHMLSPHTKATFLKKIGHTLGDSILIWDEAHNIVSAASSYMSSSLSSMAVDNATRELKALGSDFDLGYLKFTLERIAARKLQSRSEAFVEDDDMPEEIRGDLNAIVERLEKAGLEYVEKSGARRSSLSHIARFLEGWAGSDQSTARIVSRYGKNIRITLACLYPARSIEILKEPYANIFMSATLLPLGMYAQLLDRGDAVARNYSSPFPKSNKIAFIDETSSTKYDNRSAGEYRKMAGRITEIKRRIPGNVAVFFPGFDVLDAVYRHMDGVEIHVQRRGMKSAAIEGLLAGFKGSKDSLLFGVMGGSLSEGVDFPNNVIKCIIIVGIPLARPNLEINARIGYLDRRFEGKGTDYAYVIPAIIRAIQAAGRAVRSESDRAVIVFMDRRYRWGMYSSLIRNSIPLAEGVDELDAISGFWGAGLKELNAANQ